MNRRLPAALLILTAACGERGTPAADSTPAAQDSVAASAASSDRPGVTIVSPAEGDTVGGDVTVVMSGSAVLIEKAAGTRVEGVGHYHLFVDTVATADQEVIPPTNTRIIHVGTGDSTFTIKGLAPGSHEVIAVIGYGDHAAMPSQRDTVRFVVRP